MRAHYSNCSAISVTRKRYVLKLRHFFFESGKITFKKCNLKKKGNRRRSKKVINSDG